MKTTIWLVRHGQTEFNVEDRIQGVANSNLTAQGQADAKSLGRGWAKRQVRFDRAFSSDLTRANDTATLALSSSQPDLTVTKRVDLREECYGKFEGQLTSEFAQTVFNLPDLNQALKAGEITLNDIADAGHAIDPVAETALQVQTRFHKALTEIAADAEAAGHSDTLVVAHGTVIVMWLNYLLMDTQGLLGMRNASVTKLTYQNGTFTLTQLDSLDDVMAGRA